MQLIEACAVCDLARVEKWLAENRDFHHLVDCPGSAGDAWNDRRTPIEHPAKFRDTTRQEAQHAIFKLLVEHKASLFKLSRTRSECSLPLGYAVMNDREDLVHLLITLKADPTLAAFTRLHGATVAPFGPVEPVTFASRIDREDPKLSFTILARECKVRPSLAKFVDISP